MDDKEVRITNFGFMANVYRNLNRPFVDSLFLRASKTLEEINSTTSVQDIKRIQAKAKQLEEIARKQWRNIVKTANNIPPFVTLGELKSNNK